MDRLAKAIKEAARIHEESWDPNAGPFIQDGLKRSTKRFGEYKISIAQAADSAASNAGFDTRGTQPIYLLLENKWNDILDWAKQFD